MHLYIHVPFCRRACHYCDFHFSTNLTTKSALTRAMIEEMDLRKSYLPTQSLETIYFGGGTPSLLNINELHDIFEKIHALFLVSPTAEITLEANPDDITAERINVWRKFGINRLSIGIQTFDEYQLAFLNRIHTAVHAENCVKIAQDSGIDDLSIDLIYGIDPVASYAKAIKKKWATAPTDRHQIWRNDLEKAMKLNVTHLSSYCLTIEEKTVFGHWQKTNKLPEPDDIFAEEQFKILLDYTENHGFEQYEISNFARNQKYARHNTSYWLGEPYLGIGPSAHSFNGTSRQYSIANNSLYIKGVEEGDIPFTIENLSPTDEANEYIMTGLRTQWGVSITKVQEKLRTTLPASFFQIIEKYKKQGKLTEHENQLFLTKEGKFLADGIASDLFLSE